MSAVRHPTLDDGPAGGRAALSTACPQCRIPLAVRTGAYDSGQIRCPVCGHLYAFRAAVAPPVLPERLEQPLDPPPWTRPIAVPVWVVLATLLYAALATGVLASVLLFPAPAAPMNLPPLPVRKAPPIDAPPEDAAPVERE